MESEEKNMFVGAFTSGMANLALEAYWILKKPTGFPYVKVLHDVLPPGDDWIAEAGVPLLLYGIGKGTKKKGWIDAAKGAAVYGISELVGITAFRLITEMRARLGQFDIDYEFPSTNLIREFNIDYGFPSTNLIRQASWMDKQATRESKHSGDFLPFQTDMEI